MDYENNFENNFDSVNAAEAKSSAAFSDWTQKLRFDRSFSAKLILSDPKIKEYYAEIATEILKYAERPTERPSERPTSISLFRPKNSAFMPTRSNQPTI